MGKCVLIGWLADLTDVAALLFTIPHLVYRLNIDYYEHLDFIWGLNSGYYVVIYSHVIKQYSNAKLSDSVQCVYTVILQLAFTCKQDIVSYLAVIIVQQI